MPPCSAWRRPRPACGRPDHQLPGWINRLIALGILAVLVSYIGWVWSAPRSIGQNEWKVRLPNGPSTLLQIVIGMFDLGCCALAMYMLLPTEPNIGFVALLVVFVSATLLGFASHAPGGLGVFDAAMLVALWQFDKEDLLAGLLLFRVLYYLVPFVVALTILGTRESGSICAAQGLAGAAAGAGGGADPQRNRGRENRQALIMATDGQGTVARRRQAELARPAGARLARSARRCCRRRRRRRHRRGARRPRCIRRRRDRVADRRPAGRPSCSTATAASSPSTAGRAASRRRCGAASRRSSPAHAGTGRRHPPRRQAARAAARGVFRARAARPLVRGLRHAGQAAGAATAAPTSC